MWSGRSCWKGVYLPSLFKINLYLYFISSWWTAVIFYIFLESVANMSVVNYLKTCNHRLTVMTQLIMAHQKSSDQGSFKKCQHFLLHNCGIYPKESQQFKRKIVMQLFWKFPLGVTTRRTTRRTTTRRTTTRRMMYARGGSGGSGSCPAGSLDNCIDACPTQVGGHLHRNTIIWTINHKQFQTRAFKACTASCSRRCKKK